MSHHDQSGELIINHPRPRKAGLEYLSMGIPHVHLTAPVYQQSQLSRTSRQAHCSPPSPLHPNECTPVPSLESLRISSPQEPQHQPPCVLASAGCHQHFPHKSIAYTALFLCCARRGDSWFEIESLHRGYDAVRPVHFFILLSEFSDSGGCAVDEWRSCGIG